MASPKIKFKRSAVASKRPSLASLELGELALNTYDGKLFVRRDTSGVGIATTVSTVNPWTENYGSSGISYSGNISVTGVSTFSGDANFDNATLYVDSTNNRIGVGLNNPSVPLHVFGSYATLKIQNSSTAQYASASIDLQGPAGDERYTKILHGNSNTGGTETYFQIEQYDGSGSYVKQIAHYNYQNDYWNFLPAGTERLRVNTGGIDVTGHTETDTLNVSGITTLAGNTNISGNITSNVTIVSTDDGSAAAPEFKLYRNSASPADADYLGQIKFAGESDTGVERNYAKITGKILDASNGTEDGIIEFAHIKAGSQNISARFRSDSLQLINGTNLTVNGTSTFTGNILANSDSTVDIGTNSTRFANVYADTYYGDGSQLTGISAGAGGTENVSSNTTISGIITASDQFYPPTLTTSERDALTVTQGALIFNTTENKVQMYLGSEWKSLAFELDTYTAVGL